MAGVRNGDVSAKPLVRKQKRVLAQSRYTLKNLSLHPVEKDRVICADVVGSLAHY